MVDKTLRKMTFISIFTVLVDIALIVAGIAIFPYSIPVPVKVLAYLVILGLGIPWNWFVFGGLKDSKKKS